MLKSSYNNYVNSKEALNTLKVVLEYWQKERELTALEPGTPPFVRCSRAIGLCDEAADIMFRIERQSDVIERRYNKLIEQKTVFAGRAAARIRYIMQEGADGDDRTAVFVSLLGRSGRKDEIVEALAERVGISAPHHLMSPDSLYMRRASGREELYRIPPCASYRFFSTISLSFACPMQTGRFGSETSSTKKPLCVSAQNAYFPETRTVQ